MTEEAKPKGFIHSTAGLITAVAALFTSIAGLLGAYYAVTHAGAEPDRPDQHRQSATCDAPLLIDEASRAVRRDAPGVVITGGAVRQCRNGHALVRVDPDLSHCNGGEGQCLESAEVYLKVVNNVWVAMDIGTGLNCDDPQELTAMTRDICRELGLLKS